jgi:hypothetical protein
VLHVKNKSNLTSFLDPHVREILTAALTYFCVVFAVGCVLGTIRVLWIMPNLGVRNAELAEQPLMLAVVFLTARWIVRRLGSQFTKLEILSVGLIAFAILLTVEVVALLIQPERPRDTVSGVVFFAMLGIFAFMPWFLARRL